MFRLHARTLRQKPIHAYLPNERKDEPRGKVRLAEARIADLFIKVFFLSTNSASGREARARNSAPKVTP